MISNIVESIIGDEFWRGSVGDVIEKDNTTELGKLNIVTAYCFELRRQTAGPNLGCNEECFAS